MWRHQFAPGVWVVATLVIILMINYLWRHPSVPLCSSRRELYLDVFDSSIRLPIIFFSAPTNSSPVVVNVCSSLLLIELVFATALPHPASEKPLTHPRPTAEPSLPGPLCTATRQQEALSLPSAAARAHVTPKILLILDLVKFFFSKRDSIKASSILIACNTVMHLLSLK
jgi:hypothetical protein